eukprot:357673-Chlamydomonas_euryale.AAC.3
MCAAGRRGRAADDFDDTFRADDQCKDTMDGFNRADDAARWQELPPLLGGDERRTEGALPTQPEWPSHSAPELLPFGATYKVWGVEGVGFGGRGARR